MAKFTFLCRFVTKIFLQVGPKIVYIRKCCIKTCFIVDLGIFRESIAYLF